MARRMRILLAVVDNFKMYSCRVHPAGIASPSTVTRVPEDSKNVIKTASKDCHGRREEREKGKSWKFTRI